MMDKRRKVAIYMRVARAPRAWIYCRTARPDAFALRVQQNALYDFAGKNRYEVVGCTAKHESGVEMARPGLAEITNAVLRGGVDILLVHSTSRLGRAPYATLEFIGWLAEHGVEIVCMNGELSALDTGRLLRTMQAVRNKADL